MTQGRFWAASLAGGATLYFAGFLLWGLALAGFYDAHMGPVSAVTKEPVEMVYLAFSQIVSAVLLTVVMGKWAGVSGFGKGLMIGAVMGFLISLSVGLSQYSMMNLVDLTAVLIDPFVSAVWSGLGGGVIGLVLAGGRKESTA